MRMWCWVKEQTRWTKSSVQIASKLFFSTGPKLNPYYGIEIDPRGEVLDYEAIFHRQMNFDWSCDGLVVATSLSEVGYIVEASIPVATFKTLGCLHRDATGDYLLAGLYRAEFNHAPASGPVIPVRGPAIEDWISWIDPQVASPDFHVPTSFGDDSFGSADLAISLISDERTPWLRLRTS